MKDKPKVLIEIEGGNIVFTASNVQDLNIVIVDRDLIDNGQNPIKLEILYPDSNVENFQELFIGEDPVNSEIRETLKRNKI